MIQTTQYNTLKEVKKEKRRLNKLDNKKRGIHIDEIHYLIKSTINKWEDLEEIFNDYGHNFWSVEWFTEKGVPQEVVDRILRRYWGFEIPQYTFYGWDENLKDRRELQGNEYVEGVNMYEFFPLVCDSLGLKTSNIIGRGSSSRINMETIREELNIKKKEVK